MKLLRFHATWCGPCKRFEPVVNEFAAKNGLPIEHIDVEEQPDIASKYNVLTVPTTVVVDENGEAREVITGAVPSQVLAYRLRDYL